MPFTPRAADPAWAGQSRSANHCRSATAYGSLRDIILAFDIFAAEIRILDMAHDADDDRPWGQSAATAVLSDRVFSRPVLAGEGFVDQGHGLGILPVDIGETRPLQIGSSARRKSPG